MLTKDDLEQIGKLIQASEQRVTSKIETVDKKVDTVDLKVEAVHEFNKKAHAETMETLLDIGEINYKELQKELKALKKRVEQLEGRHQN
jgi:hypothetical protein